MRRIKPLLVVAGIAVVVAGVAWAAKTAMDKRQLAEETADDIEAQLGELDPVTRAAVVARLSKDAAAQVHGSH